MGVFQLLWSPDGRYLMTREESLPTTVFVWDMEALGLVSVLVQADPIKSIRWNPKPADPHQVLPPSLSPMIPNTTLIFVISLYVYL